MLRSDIRLQAANLQRSFQVGMAHELFLHFHRSAGPLEPCPIGVSKGMPAYFSLNPRLDGRRLNVILENHPLPAGLPRLSRKDKV